MLLGQDSLAVSCTRLLNILKMITKDPRKTKDMLKENENILKESETHLFGKKFPFHLKELEKSRKNSWKPLKILARRNIPFEKALRKPQLLF